MSVNQRIKELRIFVGMTQAEFASKIGKTASSVNKNEVGDTNPSGKTLNAIIEEFGVSRKWLQTGDGKMFETVANTNTSNESVKNASWSEKAHEAVKAHNRQLKEEVDFLRDLIKRLTGGKVSENFQADIVRAAKIIKLGEFGDNIVRVAS